MSDVISLMALRGIVDVLGTLVAHGKLGAHTAALKTKGG